MVVTLLPSVNLLRSFIHVLSAGQARGALKNVSQVIVHGSMIFIEGRFLDNSRFSSPQIVGLNLDNLKYVSLR